MELSSILQDMNNIYKDWIKVERSMSILGIAYPDNFFQDLHIIKACCLPKIRYIDAYEISEPTSNPKKYPVINQTSNFLRPGNLFVWLYPSRSSSLF